MDNPDLTMKDMPDLGSEITAEATDADAPETTDNAPEDANVPDNDAELAGGTDVPAGDDGGEEEPAESEAVMPEVAAALETAHAQADDTEAPFNADQTKVLLFGGLPEQLTRLAGKGEFTDLRVGKKWFEAVEEGDELDVHLSVKGELPPNEKTYPKLGEKVCRVVVKGKSLHPSLNQALDHSRRNHFILLGRARAQLEELIRKVYPNTAISKAGRDPASGFTVLTLEIVE